MASAGWLAASVCSDRLAGGSGPGTGTGNSITAAGREGIIGLGQEFGGVDDYIHIPHFVTSLAARSFTFSTWVKIAGNAGAIMGLYSGDEDWSPGENRQYFGDGNPIAPADGGGQCRDGRQAPGRRTNGPIPPW